MPSQATPQRPCGSVAGLPTPSARQATRRATWRPAINPLLCSAALPGSIAVGAVVWQSPPSPPPKDQVLLSSKCLGSWPSRNGAQIGHTCPGYTRVVGSSPCSVFKPVTVHGDRPHRRIAGHTLSKLVQHVRGPLHRAAAPAMGSELLSWCEGPWWQKHLQHHPKLPSRWSTRHQKGRCQNYAIMYVKAVPHQEYSRRPRANKYARKTRNAPGPWATRTFDRSASASRQAKESGDAPPWWVQTCVPPADRASRDGIN